MSEAPVSRSHNASSTLSKVIIIIVAGLGVFALLIWVSGLMPGKVPVIEKGGISFSAPKPVLLSPAQGAAFEEFAASFVTGLEDRTHVFLSDHFDLQAFAGRVLRGGRMPRGAMLKLAHLVDSLLWQWPGLLAAPRRVLLGTGTFDGFPSLRMRLSGAGKVEYVEVVCSQGPAGFQVVDVCLLRTGTLLSGIITPGVLQGDEASETEGKLLGALISARDGGNPEVIRAAARQLLGVGELRAAASDLLVQMAMAPEAAEDDRTEALKLLDEIPSTSGFSLAAHFTNIQRAALRRDSDAVAGEFRLLAPKLNDDPGLWVLEGILQLLLPSDAAVEKCVSKALEADPKFVDAYLLRLQFHILKNQFPAAVETLEQIRSQCGVIFGADNLPLDLFGAFLRSPDYNAWIDAVNPVPH